MKTAAGFWAFSKAGRALADLHLNYETVPMYQGAKIDTGGKNLADADYRVEKMKVPKVGGQKDLTRLIYNSKIIVTGIPPRGVRLRRQRQTRAGLGDRAPVRQD